MWEPRARKDITKLTNSYHSFIQQIANTCQVWHDVQELETSIRQGPDLRHVSGLLLEVDELVTVYVNNSAY